MYRDARNICMGCNSSGLGRAVAARQSLNSQPEFYIECSSATCQLHYPPFHVDYTQTTPSASSHICNCSTANCIQYFRPTSSLLRISQSSLVSSSSVSQSISRVDEGSSLRGTSMTRGALEPFV